MNLKTRLSELSGAALIAVLLGGSMSLLLLDALAVSFLTGEVVLCCALTAVFCGMVLLGRIPALFSALALGGGMAYLAVKDVHVVAQIKETLTAVLDTILGGEGSLNEHALVILIALCVFLTLAAFLLSRLNGGVYPAILLFMLVMMGSWFVEKRLVIAYTAPGLIALAVLYARAHRENMNYLRAFPAALIAVLIAVWLLPAGETTWAPLRDAAAKVQEMFNDYFMFTDPRTVYSVSSDGYQPQGETLGGPAAPRDAEIMNVKTNQSLLMRGSVRRTYTGSSWVDNSINSRYLFVDPTRQKVRDGIFDVDLSAALSGVTEEVTASVSILNEGTSTLFVPHRLRSLSLPLDLVAYYNDSGEVFITRGVEYGDEYEVAAYVLQGGPEEMNALLSAVSQGEDPDYHAIMEGYMNIPAGLEDDVYWLTQNLIENCETPYEKAVAIRNHLMNGGYRYTLDVDYPPLGRDFVSYFLLDSKEGYCTYYASAMAVMARLAGLPSRYVEGYLAPAEPDGETLVTGDNAHAWVEIYFEGAGWIPFDPTPGDRDGDGSDAPHPTPEPTPTPTPTPTPSPTPDPGDGENTDGENQPDQHETATPEPTATPDPEDEPNAGDLTTPTPEPGNLPPDVQQDNDQANRPWAKILIWLALILLLLLAVILLVRRRWNGTNPAAMADRQTDDRVKLMLWYRTILTLLMRSGFVPEGGETPEGFARRLVGAGAAPEQMIDLARAVQHQQYAHRPPEAAELELAMAVYQRLMIQLTPMKRIRWHIHRLLHGAGNFHQIP